MWVYHHNSQNSFTYLGVVSLVVDSLKFHLLPVYLVVTTGPFLSINYTSVWNFKVFTETIYCTRPCLLPHEIHWVDLTSLSFILPPCNHSTYLLLFFRPWKFSHSWLTQNVGGNPLRSLLGKYMYALKNSIIHLLFPPTLCSSSDIYIYFSEEHLKIVHFLMHQPFFNLLSIYLEEFIAFIYSFVMAAQM